MAVIVPRKVSLAWSDDLLRNPRSAVSETCDKLDANRRVTSGKGQEIEITGLTRIATEVEVVPTLTRLWGENADDGYRIWLADIEFPGNVRAGLSHLERVLVPGKVWTDAVIVVSKHVDDFQKELTEIGVRYRVNMHLYMTSRKPLENDVRAYVGEIVDRRRADPS